MRRYNSWLRDEFVPVTRRQTMMSALFFALGASVITGCTAGMPVRSYQPDSSGLGQCDVAMQLAYGKNLQTEMAVTGARVFKEGTEAQILSDPVCVKAHGQAIKIPPQFTLHMAGSDDFDLCDTTPSILRAPSGHDPGEATCLWNRRFRYKYPFSIALYTVDPQQELSQHLQVVRVYRNGSLAYRWISNDSANASPYSGKHVLFIPGESLRASLMPHLSGIDIRIIGTDSKLDDSTLREDIKIRKSMAEDRIAAFLRGAMTSSVFSGGTLKCEYDALQRRAEAMKCMADTLIDDQARSACRKTAASAISTACDGAKKDPTPNVDGVKTRDFYDKVRSGLTKDLEMAEDQARDEIREWVRQYDNDARTALEDFNQVATNYFEAKDHAPWKVFLDAVNAAGKQGEFAALSDMDALKKAAQNLKSALPTDDPEEFFHWLKLRSSGTTLAQVKAQAETLMQQALSIVGNADQLFGRLRADSEKLRTDHKAQVQLYNDVFQSLQSTTSVFEQYANNPLPLPGESVLNMAYSDRFQGFLLAPWHGVAFHVSKNKKLDFSFNATNLVPIIDIAGLRAQFGRTRYGDLRLALGTALMVEEVTKADTETPEQVFSFIPQVSLGLANLKVGVGMAAYTNDEWGWSVPRLRYFVGADLYKMISGMNIEGL